MSDRKIKFSNTDSRDFFPTLTSLERSLFLPTSKKRIGFLSVHFAAGLVLAVIFQLVQSEEGKLYPLLNGRSFISQHYPTHQVEATVKFSAT